MNSEINKNGLCDRLRALWVSKDLVIRDIAKEIGVIESPYRDWEYGRQMKDDHLEKYAIRFTCRP